MRSLIIMCLSVFFASELSFGQGNFVLIGTHSSFECTREVGCESGKLDCTKENSGNFYNLFKKICAAIPIGGGVDLYSANIFGSARYYKYKEKGHIVFNPADFIDNDLFFVLVIGHEIGHYQNHHDDFCGSISELELIADYSSGFLVSKMGFQREILKSFILNYFIDDKNEFSCAYPSPKDRISKILAGFDAANSGSGINDYTNNNVRVFWEKDPEEKITISDSGKDKIFTIGDILSNGGSWGANGVVYVPQISATIQLNDWNYFTKRKGEGRLVNIRTPITWWKTSRNKFDFYVKGVSTKMAEHRWCDESKDSFCKKGDYIVKYADGISVLENYDRAAVGLLHSGYLVSIK